MKLQEYNESYRQMSDSLRKHRINEAIMICRQTLSQIPNTENLKAQLERQAETYRYLSSYALDGYSDPTRTEQIALLEKHIDSIMMQAARELKIAGDTALYYATLRYLRLHPELTISSVAADFRQLSGKYNMAVFADFGNDNGSLRQAKAQVERAERDLFLQIWTAGMLSRQDVEAIRELLLNDDIAARRTKSLIVGALFLGLLEMFDSQRIGLLIDAYEHSERNVGLRALTYLLVALTVADKEALDRTAELRPRMAALAEEASWRNDVTEVFRQLLISRDTDRISRKMENDIFPSMRNIGNKIKQMMKEKNLINDPENQESPNIDDWQELIDNAGLNEKMREISEIQEEGGDIMMNTFAHLKDFSFFKEIANWFIPYEPDHTEIPTTPVIARAAELLQSAPMFCDNDKYSMIFSLTRMPESNHKLVADQFEQQTEHLAEIQAAGMGLQSESANRIVNTVRDLYRFFNTFNRAKEFDNPFATSLNLLKVDLIKDTIDVEALRKLASDFYFTHDYYEDALPLLKAMETSVQPGDEAELYYRIGICLKNLGDTAGALTYLQRSELFDDKRRNTLVELGQAYRHADNPRKAYEAFRRASSLSKEPENSLQLLMADALIEMESYEEAVAILYKLEFFFGLTPAFMRKLAYCEMMLGHDEKCREHLNKLNQQNADDMLMTAALNIAEGRYREAVDNLRSAQRLSGGEALERLDTYTSKVGDRSIDPSIVDIIKDNI